MLRGLVVSGLVLLLAVGAGLYYSHITAYNGKVPELSSTQWWGQGKARADNPAVKPFKINYSKEVLDDLSQRLRNTKPFQTPLEGVGFEYGFNSNFLQTVLDFWKTKYSWPKRQEFLNSLPQFTTEIQGLQIHFIHAKPTKTAGLKVVPLLLVHGWPGSVREFYELIPLLTSPRAGQDFVFEVIAPSLPGYGFSEGAARPGMGPAHIGVVLDNLMHRLGFQKYFVQGGDWGSIIVTYLSQIRTESILGLHTNMPFVMPNLINSLQLVVGSYFPSLVATEHEQKYVFPMSKRYLYILEESGYLHIQATKPDTIGVALRDSPIGLAAYIMEKFSTWTNPAWKSLPDGGLLKKFKLEDLLDNVMIYWLTYSATTSVRLYSENFNFAQTALGFDKLPVTVPCGIARFPYELNFQPKSILEMRYKNIVQLSDFQTGGHFAAFEEPNILADDIWSFVNMVLHPKIQNNNE